MIHVCYECGRSGSLPGSFVVTGEGLAHCRKRSACEKRSAKDRHRYERAARRPRKPMFVREGECLVWQGRRNKAGYGQVTVNGWPIGVHRLVYIVTHGGEEPPVVRHICDNPPCAEPSHLLGGTYLDNYRDTIARDRHPTQKGLPTSPNRSQGHLPTGCPHPSPHE